MENQRKASHLSDLRAVKDLLIVSAISVAAFVISSHIDILEKFATFSHQYEHLLAIAALNRVGWPSS